MLIHVLMMYDDMHNVVNVYIMHVFVNGLWYGLECEHMSLWIVVDGCMLGELACILWPLWW